jgi:hypothetical protein
MLKLGKTQRAIALAAATLALVGSATITTASAAYASGCTGGSGCSHQTTIYFTDFAGMPGYEGTTEWWGPATVLKMQSDGNLVLYCQGYGSSSAKWATGTVIPWNSPADNGMVDFQNSGNMSVWWEYPNFGPPSYSAKWVSKTEPPTINDRGAYAVVQADGNFVIYDSAGVALWATNTYHACPGTLGYWG